MMFLHGPLASMPGNSSTFDELGAGAGVMVGSSNTVRKLAYVALVERVLGMMRIVTYLEQEQEHQR